MHHPTPDRTGTCFLHWIGTVKRSAAEPGVTGSLRTHGGGRISSSKNERTCVEIELE
jgi:hypothetical protein